MNLAALSMLSLSLGLAEPSPNDIIPTNSRLHKLQIDYKPEQKPRIQRVELCVSTDQGAVWRVADAVTPDKDHLLLKATTDGIYWVKMVIVFRDGTREPADVMRMQPDFKMLIDTTPPTVKLNATRAGDEIVLDWTIDDKNPNDAATQVVYRGVGEYAGDWLPLAPSAIIKRTAKFKPALPGPIVVQVVVADQVGNPGNAAKEVASANGATTSTSLSPTTTNPNGVFPLERPFGAATTGGSTAPTTNPAAPGAGPTMPGPVVLPGPINTNEAVNPVSNAAVQPLPTPNPVAPAPIATAPVGPAPVSPALAPLMGTQAQPIKPTSGNIPLPVMPASEVRNPQPMWSGQNSPVTPSEPTPPAINVQSINFLRFDLQYQLDNGPSGISRVDLYVTRDEGRNWVRWSEHDGRQQPLKVVLDAPFNQQREGDYGFRLVPVSGAGLSDGAPASDTPPELRVNVDLTPPLIRPFMPTADPNQRNTLTLLWEATDKNFAANPIAIEWSETPTGPWKAVNAPETVPTSSGMPLPVAGQAPIAAAPVQRLPNTGSYAWALPANMNTHKVFLRFTAWDAAGNKSEVVTQSPVMVDLVKPKARIQGIATPVIPARP